MIPRVVCTLRTCGGQPRLSGRRLTVYDVVSKTQMDGMDEFLSDYSVDGLTEEEVKACIVYCRNRQCLLDAPACFCYGCTYCFALSMQSWQEYVRESEIVTVDSALADPLEPGTHLFLGSTSELAEKLRGQDGWVVAARLYSQYMTRLGLPDVPPRPVAEGAGRFLSTEDRSSTKGRGPNIPGSNDHPANHISGS